MNIYKAASVFAIVSMLASSCIVEDADPIDVGTALANIDKPGTTSFFFNPDADTGVEFDVAVTGPASFSEVRVFKQLSSSLGDSDKVLSETYTSSPFTVAQSESELFADVPVAGETLDENDLVPGDAFTYSYEIELSDGMVLTPSYTHFVPFACISEIPTGEWLAEIVDGAFGASSSNDVIITRVEGSETQYMVTDITAGVLPGLGCCDDEESITFEDVCNSITVVVAGGDASFNYETNSDEGFGAGSWDPATQTLIIPWWEPANAFGGVTRFTRN
ncbi:MAG: hypothetical protein AAF149_10220 [Bacteroidota bacterium]